MTSDLEIVCSYTRAVTRRREGLSDQVARGEREAVLRAMILRCLDTTGDSCALSYDALVDVTGKDAPFVRRRDLSERVMSRFPLPEGISWTPSLVGWAYQVWNEPARHAQSWGVSQRERRQAEHANVARLTQIFTDDYIADFITRRCFALSERTGSRDKHREYISCFDPGCGAGHMLLSAIRNYPISFPGGCLSELQVHGADIDQDAVELCRILVFIEFVRQGFNGDRKKLWCSLLESISAVDAPFGTLQRAHVSQDSSFDIVVTNPPYLGRRKMSGALRDFLDQEYPITRIDLAAAFVQRCVELTRAAGVVGFVTNDKWLRLRGYNGFRRGGGEYKGFLREVALDVVCELGPRAFHRNTSLHDGIRFSVMCGRKAAPKPDHVFSYSSLSSLAPYDEKVSLVRRLTCAADVGTLCRGVSQTKLLDEDPRRLFLEAGPVSASLRGSTRTVADIAHIVIGLQTNNDERFVRYVWQVPGATPGWIPYSKGGGYRRWIGANHWLLDCREGFGRYARSAAGARAAEKWCARPGWNYSWLANGSLGLRLKEGGWSFGRAASTGVFCEDPRLIAYLNSRVASLCARLLGGKIQLPEGVTRLIPVPTSLEPIDPAVVERIVELKRLLIERDPTDILYRPPTKRHSFDWRVLEALIVLLEGCLEAQIEEALSLSDLESQELGRSSGIPVGLIAVSDAVSEDTFWNRVPQEYRTLRDLVRSVADRYRHVRKHNLSFSAAALSKVLSGKGKQRGCWILPADGSVEKLSRYFYMNPIELVLHWGEIVEQDSYLGTAERHESARERVLEIVLETLGHQWWSSREVVKRLSVGAVDVSDIADAIRYAEPSIEELLAIERPLKEWLLGDFAVWMKGLFRGAPPIAWYRNKGELIYKMD